VLIRRPDADPPPALQREPAPNRPRVLFVLDHLGYPGGVVHGGTSYCSSVLPGLARHGVTTKLCVLREEHPAAAALAARDVETVFLHRHRWDPRALIDLWGVVRRVRPDILHLLSFKAMTLGSLIAREAGLAAVLHLHDRTPPPPLLRPVLRRLARQAQATIAVSGSVAEFITGTYHLPASRLTVLHNGIDLAGIRVPCDAERAAQRARLGIPETAPVIAVVGRLFPNKRQAMLIGLMPAVLQACPGAVLLVVGDGAERPDCEAEVRRLGLGGVVRLLGQRPDVTDLLAAADLLALPSGSEGLPYALIEAAALALPAVACATGGVPEIVRHEVTGLLVPPDDAHGFARAIIRVLRDPVLARRLGTAARQHVGRFDLEHHLGRLIALYHGALAGAPAQRAQTACPARGIQGALE
jgi:glycosyltransferase involved in cell wall biosynthesis